ncbi:MAG: gamma-glutamyl-gamma-aminobutyrate hydrolase family protein [Defluviitaleaceae bacterium]|nr:gamma-glutamyl-gamma-aminobutyrate hydrolase family protein [Defluviitaleaceae bacterium]
MKPIIGITPYFTDDQKYSLNSPYVASLLACGVTPIILPYDPESIPTYLKMISGLLLSGGGDIDASYFNQEPHEKAGAPTIARDEFELALCREAVKINMPVLGICRGEQVLNVALGGNILQHIEEGGHQFGEKRTEYIHSVKLAEGSKLRSIIGQDEIETNSIHHQSVGDKLGEGVSISAVSPDGIIEAIEVASKKFVIGLQWHPEELAAKDSNHMAIFRAFTDAARS